jgi:hypothetical protein
VKINVTQNSHAYGIIIIIILITFSGVVAGMWPCGILIMLKELFVAESKSQVYAALHELLSSHRDISTSLRMHKLS